ncbi:MAG: hypothetical protein PF483_16095 [Halothiobacillus sp.]|jgi:hypothetical protein|nr:hypothetical protein [Halothiobacillus sp.]
MENHIRKNNPTYSLLPTDIAGFDSLAELALDLRWSWNHYGDKIWSELEQKWASLRFGEVKVETRDEQYAFEIKVHLNGLNPNAVRVELYADGVNGASPEKQEMKRILQPETASAGTEYHAVVSSTRPATDYTARVIPYFDGVTIPLEDQRILWQDKSL